MAVMAGRRAGRAGQGAGGSSFELQLNSGACSELVVEGAVHCCWSVADTTKPNAAAKFSTKRLRAPAGAIDPFCACRAWRRGAMGTSDTWHYGYSARPHQ